MRRVTIGLASLIALGCEALSSAHAVEVDSRAERITITGRIQTGWYTTSVEGEPGSEFLVRRARAALRVQINDWISGVVEPDFARGVSIELKDCYFRMSPTTHWDISVGQMKRRFDLFELTSSTQILVIERDGRIGVRVTPGLTPYPTYSWLTENLLYSDRDIGLFGQWHNEPDRLRIEGAITNGAPANTRPVIGAKAFQGRVSVLPAEDVAVHFGVSVRPFRTVFTPLAAPPDTGTTYGTAFEGSTEWGNYTQGAHVQAGIVFGTNPFTYSSLTDDIDSFFSFQVIGTYKHLLANKRWFEAVEPVFRFGFGDFNTEIDDDAGVLLTPGVNLWIVGRTRLAANIDIFVPEQNQPTPANPTPVEEDTEVSFKAASWLYF